MTLRINRLLGSSSFPTATSISPISYLKITKVACDVWYDGERKQPRLVHQYLTRDKAHGEINREKFHFHLDPLVPKVMRSTTEDYQGSGFDKGHLCPAADAKYSNEAMQDTFDLSNVSPQCPKFNRGYWAKLEKHVRDLTDQYPKGLDVFTGPLYRSHEESGKRYVKYQVIGENEVAVPTHYFKVIFNSEGHSVIRAYILPNEDIPDDRPLDEFETTVETIEKVAGIAFDILNKSD